MHSGHFSKFYLSSLFVKFISSNNYYMLFFHLLFVLLSKTLLLPSFHPPSSIWYNKVWIILFAINNLIHSSTEASLIVSSSWVVCLLFDCMNLTIDCFFIPDPQYILVLALLPRRPSLRLWMEIRWLHNYVCCILTVSLSTQQFAMVLASSDLVRWSTGHWPLSPPLTLSTRCFRSSRQAYGW